MRLLHLLAPAAAATAETMQLAWTTDNQLGQGMYGPDGPWQAIAVKVGNYSIISAPWSFDGEFAALWPSDEGVTRVLTRAARGNYTAANSSTVAVTQEFLNASDTLTNQRSYGKGVFDLVTLSRKEVLGVDADFRANATLAAVEQWTTQNPDGSLDFASVGILGLGSSRALADFNPPPGILQQLKSQGRIASMSLGLHIGSAALGQPGSLVLGGYEQNRALGSVGVFSYIPNSYRPSFFLLDVLLGTQVGASPFAKPEDSGSFWQGTGDDEQAEYNAQISGVGPGTALVRLDPTSPYIYLPPATCKAAASRLPLRWNPGLGLYIWNTHDLAYERIVRSSAYLAFVFADSTATNITIKVPFRLLNLTLEPPLFPRTPYFPCKPSNDSSGMWVLGRAFLQAAFFGVNLERNLSYLAQAPGPAMEQSVVHTLWPADKAPQTNPIGEFEKSWMPSWTVLQEDSPSASAEASSDGTGALSTGALAGIVVGVVVALAAAAVAVWFFLRRMARAKANKPPPAGTGTDGEWAASVEGVTEMAGQGNIAELGKPGAHEMWSPPVTHELPTDEFARHEFPAHDLPTHNLPTHDFPIDEGQGGYNVPRRSPS